MELLSTASISAPKSNALFCVKAGTTVTWKSTSKNIGFVVDPGTSRLWDRREPSSAVPIALSLWWQRPRGATSIPREPACRGQSTACARKRMQSSLSSAAIERDEVSVCLPPLHTTRNGARNRRLMMALLMLLPCVPARAQTSTTEFFPEIDANYHLNSKLGFVFQAKETREGGSPTQAELGPSTEFFLPEAFGQAQRPHRC